MLSKNTSSDHSFERQLIICCARTEAPDTTIEEVRSIIGRSLDWDYILQVSTRNGVAPLISSFLLNHGLSDLRPETVELLKICVTQQQARNLFLTAQMLKIVRLFQLNDILAVPFKGPLLAIQAYGDPCLRSFSDLDILVHVERFKSAVRLLKENGFTPLTSVSWLEKRDWYVSQKKDIYFVNADQSIILELHWKLSGSHFGLPGVMNSLWERLETLELGGTTLRTLAFDDQLIYLCLHGARHYWERFQWICDVHELIKAKRKIDWDVLIGKAKRLGCERVVVLGLRLVHEFFGFRIPSSLPEDVIDNAIYDEMCDTIRLRLFSIETNRANIGERYLNHLRLKERASDRWKLHFYYIKWYMHIILAPNEIDKNIIYLPKLFNPLYYLLRPIRLLLNCLVRVKDFVSTSTSV